MASADNLNRLNVIHLLLNQLLDCRSINGNRRKIFMDDIKNWIVETRIGKTSILIAYSLGKAQRLLKEPLKQQKTYLCTWCSLQHARKRFVIMDGIFLKLKGYSRYIKRSIKESVVHCASGADGSPWIKRFLSLFSRSLQRMDAGAG